MGTEIVGGWMDKEGVVRMKLSITQKIMESSSEATWIRSGGIILSDTEPGTERQISH